MLANSKVDVLILSIFSGLFIYDILVVKSFPDSEFKIVFLPIGAVEDLHTKPKYAKHFDIVYFSSGFAFVS